MSRELTAALERLGAEEAFRLMYGAYLHLARLEGEVASATVALLRRLRAGEAAAVLHCVKKMLEEQDEVRRVLAGEHRHEGQTARQTLVNELQQMVYWSALTAAARGIEAEVIRLADFLTAGVEGREPDKAAFEEGGHAEVVILRRTLTAAGRALAAFNRAHPAEAVEPREVAMADLRQMAERDYLSGHLSAALLKNQNSACVSVPRRG
jgi:hypothetical protein